MRTIVIIPGDGIGEEITEATLEVLDAMNLPFSYEKVQMGQKALDEEGHIIPPKVFEAIEKHKVALKGPVTTPIGEGFSSVNVALRKKFDLFANIRPIRGYGNIPCLYPKTDLVIFRENTEDLYAGMEKQVSSEEAHSIKIITKKATERIAVKAFEYALAHKIPKITIVTKANIMKLSDGLFLKTAREVGKNYPSIEKEEILIDNMAMQLVLNPYNTPLILTENLYGDILSDLCAGLIGGIGLAPGANIGKDVAVFEAVHGSAPTIAGKGIANPTALLLSAALMLDHLQYYQEAKHLRETLDIYLSNPDHFTRDLGGCATTKEFTQGLIKALKVKGV